MGVFAYPRKNHHSSKKPLQSEGAAEQYRSGSSHGTENPRKVTCCTTEELCDRQHQQGLEPIILSQNLVAESITIAT